MDALNLGLKIILEKVTTLGYFSITCVVWRKIALNLPQGLFLSIHQNYVRVWNIFGICFRFICGIVQSMKNVR